MKPLLFAIGIVMLLTTCKKEEQVTINWISIEQEQNEIVCRFEALIDGQPRSLLDVGILWGTSSDLFTDGVSINDYNMYSGGTEIRITDFETGTYYFQAYLNYTEGTYYTDVRSFSTTKKWKVMPNQPPLTCHRFSVAPNGNIHVVGYDGIHFYSTDQGNTWNTITHVNTADLGGLVFVSNDVAYLTVGFNLRKSVDGGMTWSDITDPFINYDGGYFMDANTFLISKDDSIFKTTNGGNTYTAAFAPAGGDYGSLFFLNASTGYGLSTDGNVVKTSNGGTTWTLQNTTAIVGYCRQIWFFDEFTGLVIREDYVYRTIDGGITWTKVADLEDQALTMRFYDANHGAIGGNYGMLIETQNGGLNWQTNYFPDNNDHIMGVYLLNDSLGYAIDDDGTMLIYE